MSDTKQKISLGSRIGAWAAELVLVFVGVYAAFWLNNYQQQQEQLKRHDQILALLEQRLEISIASAKTESAREERQVAEFNRALQAGQMPPLRPFSFTSDYSSTDIATLLQSGGIELLDIKTLAALGQLESVIRAGLAEISHYQKLSDELIVPNLDQDISFFYDPGTKKLRKRFEKYPDVLQSTVDFFHQYEKAQDQLLRQIRAERQRH